jgi:hypothetical protein
MSGKPRFSVFQPWAEPSLSKKTNGDRLRLLFPVHGDHAEEQQVIRREVLEWNTDVGWNLKRRRSCSRCWLLGGVHSHMNNDAELARVPNWLTSLKMFSPPKERQSE